MIRNSTIAVANSACAMVARGVAHLERDVGGQRAHRLQDRVRDAHRVAGHHDHRHGLAHRAAHAEDDRGDDSRARGGQHHAADGLPLRGAERERSLPVTARHRFEGVDGDADDGGQDHDSEDHRAGQRRGARAAQVLADPRHQQHHAHEAVHHRRNPGQQLDGRFENPAQPGRRQLGQHYSAGQRERHADRQRTDGDHGRAGDHRQDAEVAGCGAPVGREEIAQSDLGDEGHPLAEYEECDRRQDSDAAQRQQQQPAFDDFVTQGHAGITPWVAAGPRGGSAPAPRGPRSSR